MAEKIATRASYGRALVELGAENPDIVVLDADLSGSTQTKKFADKYPERFFNAGIAEENMVGMAAGLALSGKIPFCSSFAMFASGRAWEIIRNAVAHNRANVKICASHAGITVGADGATHQCLEDLAIMRAIPGMTVINPADDVSARKLIKQAASINAPCYIRLGRAACPVVYGEDVPVEIGKALQVREGLDFTVIATGIMVEKAMEAAEILEKEGIEIRILDMHTIKPIDKEAIIHAALETNGIVTAEEHSIVGGLGSAVAEVTATCAPCKMAMIGVKDRMGESAEPDQLIEKYGLTGEDIAEAVRSLR